MPTYLYIKEHELTGLRYFGKTSKADPYKYNGSGKHWIRHIKKHGKKYVKTLWVSEPFTDKETLIKLAISISEKFNIVKSKDWANLIIENGIDGWTPGQKRNIPVSDKTKQKMSYAKLGIPKSEEHKIKISAALSGKVFSEQHLQNLRKPKGLQKKLECPFCNKFGGATGMTRWHFENCKFYK